MAEFHPWWVNGTLFENCNCQLLCPAHVSFKQECDEDPCRGFWGDQSVDETQRRTLEQILTGEVGGPWAIIGKFITERLEARGSSRYSDGGVA